jgi:CheY-like chemotaxis protein
MAVHYLRRKTRQTQCFGLKHQTALDLHTVYKFNKCMMCRLLMIDDNPIEHFIVQRMLDTYKLFPNVVHSLDGRSMIQSLRKNINQSDQIPDVIFLDLDMPDYSGWEFLKRFNKEIDVHIVSSSIDPRDILKSKKYSFVKSFISKPFKKQMLEDLFLKWSG